MMMVIPTFGFFVILMLVTFAGAVAAAESNTRTTTNVEPLLENAEEQAPTAEKFTLASSSSSSSSAPRTQHRYMSHRHRSRIDLVITNATPYPVSYTGIYYAFCEKDIFEDEIAAGATWRAPSRGACLVDYLEVALVDIEDYRRPYLECMPFTSSPATRQADYRIIMRGDEEVCCVRSSQESQECPEPKVKKSGPSRTWVYPKVRRGGDNYDL